MRGFLYFEPYLGWHFTSYFFTKIFWNVSWKEATVYYDYKRERPAHKIICQNLKFTYKTRNWHIQEHINQQTKCFFLFIIFMCMIWIRGSNKGNWPIEMYHLLERSAKVPFSIYFTLDFDQNTTQQKWIGKRLMKSWEQWGSLENRLHPSLAYFNQYVLPNQMCGMWTRLMLTAPICLWNIFGCRQEQSGCL